MKDPVRTFLNKLGGERDASADKSTVDATVATTHAPDWMPTERPTGETIFGDLPLRFRSLTLTAADVDALEDSSPFHGGFKIRIARRSGGRRDQARHTCRV
jgi:hypothetical protein